MSNQSQGAVLAGQPVAVTAGSGITIDPSTGVISVNAATISGVMKLNNGSAYNAYQWPNSPGTAGQFLQTNGAGLVDWADVQGFAVVSVQSGAPSPADIGELWFDCDTGTLNVYQNCVGSPSPNWFNVAQPGFPVLPGNTGASPGFAGGTGTQADPYDCTVTTTGSGTTVQIIQTVTVTGLAAFQFVPIVDLNAVANGGRFSFTNNYADSSGNLTFDILFSDNPPSASGTPYIAAIKVGYGSAYIEARVNVVAALVVTGGSIAGPLYVGQQLTYTPGVPSGGSTPYGTPTYQWFANGTPIGGATGLTFTLTGAQLNAQITASTTYSDSSGQTATGTSAAVGPVLANPGALTITSPGSISPATNVVVGNTLSYTAGTFTGGIPTVTPSWKWQRNGTDIAGVAANATSYVTVSADSGQAITVRYQVQDSSTPTPVTQFASTTAVTPTSPFPGGVWAPTPANAMDNTNPGTSSGLWNGPASTVITATGCAEVSLDGIFWSSSVTVSNPQTLYQRWKQTALCGLNDTGQTIQGSVTDGTYTNSYSLLINRVPSAAPSYTAATGAPGAAVDSNSQNISGMNSTTYITYDASSTGDSTTYFAIINGGAAQAIPSAPSTSLTIESGDTLVLRQTASSTPATARNLVVNIGDADGSPRQQATYTLTAVSTPFPGITFSPASGPNAGPETVNGVTGGGTLGTLNGKASTSWTPVNTALTGSNIRMQINGTGGYSTSATAVNGQSLEIAWVTSYLDTITNGNSATGSISGTISGTTYTNPFSFTVKRTADFTTTSGASSGASGSITLVSQTPNNYNVPLKVYQNVPGSNPLTSVTVDIGSTGPVLLPTTSGSALTINPGQTIVFTATAPGTPNTYTTDIVIGDTTKTWSYTVTVTPTVSTPSINNPNAGTTVDPSLAVPPGVTITTPTTGNPGGFQTNYGGTQTAADWYVYKAIPQSPETSGIVTVGTVAGGSWASKVNPGAAASTYMMPWAFNWGTSGNLYLWRYWNGALAVDYSTDGGTTLGGNVWTYGSPHNYISWNPVSGLWLRGGSTFFCYSATSPTGPWTQFPSGTVPTASGYFAYTNYATDTGMSVFGSLADPTDPNYPGSRSALISTNTSTFYTATFPAGIIGAVSTSGSSPKTSVYYLDWDGSSTLGAVSSSDFYYYIGGITANISSGSWTSSLTSSPNVFLGCTYDNTLNLWIAVDSGGRFSTSTDAIAWTTVASGVAIDRVAFVEGLGAMGASTASNQTVFFNGTTATTRSLPAGQTTNIIMGIKETNEFWITAASKNLYGSSGGGAWAPGITTSSVQFGGTGLEMCGYDNGTSKYYAGAIGGNTSSNTWVTTSNPYATRTQLTFANNQNLSSMVAGDNVVEVGGGADASGTIGSINLAGPSMTLATSTGTWNTGSTVKDTSQLTTPPAPPALPPTVPDNTKYQAVSGFPLNVTSAPFNTVFIPQANLSASSTYYASVINTGTGSVVSTAATWSDFDTV